MDIFILVKPLKIKLISKEKFYRANEQYEILCEVFGSRPYPEITWWLERKVLHTASETVSVTN